VLNLTALATKYAFILDCVSLHFDLIQYKCRPVLLQQTCVSTESENCFLFLIGGRMSILDVRVGREPREKNSVLQKVSFVRYPN
jgi:hypothetical protein